jgi:SNF2 family DNA or RNA helicase
MVLFQWQQRARRDAAPHDGWGLFARPGTGKTLAALTIAADWQTVPVVVAPMAVKQQWREQGVKHVYHYEQLRIARYQTEIADLLHRHRCCLILDESHKVANPSTATTKSALRLGRLAAKRLVLTGTPTANSPADLWAQLKFLRPDATLESHKAFKSRYLVGLPSSHPLMMRIRGNPFIPRRHRDGTLMLQNTEELTRRVAHYGTSVDESEIADLPPRTFVTRRCEASPELRRAYDELRRRCITEIQGCVLTAENAAVLATRLLRLASGLGEADSPVKLPNPKLSLLLADLDQIVSEGRTIIWSVWTQERDEIAAALRERPYLWTDDVQLFQRDTAYRVLLGSPKVIGAGLNLQSATYQCWVSRTWSLIEREQALHRNYRVGQTQPTTVIDYITDGTIEAQVMRALDAKSNLLTLIMENGAIE